MFSRQENPGGERVTVVGRSRQRERDRERKGEGKRREGERERHRENMNYAFCGSLEKLQLLCSKYGWDHQRKNQEEEAQSVREQEKAEGQWRVRGVVRRGEKTRRGAAPKKEDGQGSLGEDTLECLLRKRSLKWTKVEMPRRPAWTGPWSSGEHDVRGLVAAGAGLQNEQVADGKWSRVEETEFMLIIGNVPPVSRLRGSLLASGHSRWGSCHFFSILARTLRWAPQVVKGLFCGKGKFHRLFWVYLVTD